MPKYGQHFLLNEHAVLRIVDNLGLSRTDNVLEIGPGKGALTQHLAEIGCQLLAIEVDPELAQKLQTKYAHCSHIRILNQDILSFNLDGFNPGENRIWKIVGNLPYNLTSPILREMGEWTRWSEAVIMVQKEVGDRLSAKPGTADYGALTVGVSLTCTVEKIFDLSPTSFRPPPKVYSSVLKLRRRAQPLTEFPNLVQKVIQAAFQQRRKTILNSLSHGLHIDKEKIKNILSACNIDVHERPENIDTAGFLLLTQTLKGQGWPN